MQRLPFAVPDEMAEPGLSRPLRRFVYPDGRPGWIVTGHSLARAVLADARFSSRAELKQLPVHRPGVEPFYGMPAVPGWFIDMDPPEHTRYRRLLAGQFTVQRTNEMRPTVERVVADRLSVMEEAGPPVDLVGTLAVPTPLLIITGLLGVTGSEQDEFHRLSAAMFSFEATAAEADEAHEALTGLLVDVARNRRSRPRPDLLSRLVTGGLTDQEAAGAGVLLLTAGHETVSGLIGLGCYALLADAEQVAALREGRVDIDRAVEELLRFVPVLLFGVPRSPLQDIEVDGQLFRTGETVTVSLASANRDPARFDMPEELHLSREARSNIAFGHGLHQCIGQHLARIELRAALAGLFARFPDIRLAEPSRAPTPIGSELNGLLDLPVAWG